MDLQVNNQLFFIKGHLVDLSKFRNHAVGMANQLYQEPRVYLSKCFENSYLSSVHPRWCHYESREPFYHKPRSNSGKRRKKPHLEDVFLPNYDDEGSRYSWKCPNKTTTDSRHVKINGKKESKILRDLNPKKNNNEKSENAIKNNSKDKIKSENLQNFIMDDEIIVIDEEENNHYKVPIGIKNEELHKNHPEQPQNSLSVLGKFEKNYLPQKSEQELTQILLKEIEEFLIPNKKNEETNGRNKQKDEDHKTKKRYRSRSLDDGTVKKKYFEAPPKQDIVSKQKNEDPDATMVICFEDTNNEDKKIKEKKQTTTCCDLNGKKRKKYLDNAKKSDCAHLNSKLSFSIDLKAKSSDINSRRNTYSTDEHILEIIEEKQELFNTLFGTNDDVISFRGQTYKIPTDKNKKKSISNQTIAASGRRHSEPIMKRTNSNEKYIKNQKKLFTAEEKILNDVVLDECNNLILPNTFPREKLDKISYTERFCVATISKNVQIETKSETIKQRSPTIDLTREEEGITLYRAEETTNTFEEIQAMVASLPAQPIMNKNRDLDVRIEQNVTKIVTSKQIPPPGMRALQETPIRIPREKFQLLDVVEQTAMEISKEMCVYYHVLRAEEAYNNSLVTVHTNVGDIRRELLWFGKYSGDRFLYQQRCLLNKLTVIAGSYMINDRQSIELLLNRVFSILVAQFRLKVSKLWVFLTLNKLLNVSFKENHKIPIVSLLQRSLRNFQHKVTQRMCKSFDCITRQQIVEIRNQIQKYNRDIYSYTKNIFKIDMSFLLREPPCVVTITEQGWIKLIMPEYIQHPQRNKNNEVRTFSNDLNPNLTHQSTISTPQVIPNKPVDNFKIRLPYSEPRIPRSTCAQTVTQSDASKSTVIGCDVAGEKPAPITVPRRTVEDDQLDVIDLTWVDDVDPEQLQREIQEVYVKKELEVKKEVDENEEADNDAQPITVTVEKQCVCGVIAQYVCVCSNAWYCSENCQLTDWEPHRSLCRSTTFTGTDVPDPISNNV